MNNMPKKIVLIGASTGGPGQIEKIISSLDVLDDTSIIIAQHMVRGFLESFVKRLQENSKNNIYFVQNSMELLASNIYVCSGYTKLYEESNNLMFAISKSPENSYNPDINIIFNSYLPYAKNFTTLCVILTGIGEDGVEGCKNLSISGSRCMTESSTSAIVDGMPSSARKNISNIEVLEMEDIIINIKEFCNQC